MMDRLLENNTVLKILSVIVAIFIWFQAGASTTQSINRSVGPVAVGFPSLNPHLSVLSITPSSVMVQIKGPPSSVESSAMASEVSASINLAKITGPGTYSMKVAGSVPPGIGVVSVTPSRVVVSVAKIGQKKAPVVVHIAGQPLAGDQLVGYKTSDKEATIFGPTGALRQVTAVEGTLAITDRSDSFSASVVLHPVNAQGQTVGKVEINPPATRVTAMIQPKPPEKVLPVISKLSGKPVAGYQVSQITVYPSSVTVTGTKSLLSSLSHLYTEPVVVSGARKSFSVLVPVVLPKGLTLISSGDVTVTVTISGVG
ncbi:MAG: hypothetical protein C7B45_02785 [Sulfobacillus acidophilus]|uniref:YbbR-like domain-containing protein n=1 Tax=Sulfobacillus acidophilus TaxID=53633 RepID=A0A2T2WML8_9FIRM|nr:MAG: hypothetical protein C7B45_02785 [Sulfobacillus acidophilus]